MKRFLTWFLLVVSTGLSSAQTEEDPELNIPSKVKGFHAGFFAGTLFANKYTAALYDGYGYDLDGNKNTFANSFMYRKIVWEYGGGNGQTDQIAQALNVSHGDWSFDETDMPVNMQYNVAFLVGVNTRYCFNKKEALVFNVNGSKLNLTGDFTIVTVSGNMGTGLQGVNKINTFSITGGEQRVIFQVGYQHIFGDDEKINLFVEGGPSLTLVKFEKNEIRINNLQMDITSYYNYSNYMVYKARNLTGIGFGVFAGLGVNLSMSKKWTVQLLYSPSLEDINIGKDPHLTLQNALGLRGYYNF